MDFYFSWQNLFVLLSIVIYFIYDYFDGKQVKDEREELIKLKTFALVQKVNMTALFLLSLVYFFVPFISGVIIIVVLILSSLYSEILAKIYYRKSL